MRTMVATAALGGAGISVGAWEGVEGQGLHGRDAEEDAHYASGLLVHGCFAEDEHGEDGKGEVGGRVKDGNGVGADGEDGGVDAGAFVVRVEVPPEGDGLALVDGDDGPEEAEDNAAGHEKSDDPDL